MTCRHEDETAGRRSRGEATRAPDMSPSSTRAGSPPVLVWRPTDRPTVEPPLRYYNSDRTDYNNKRFVPEFTFEARARGVAFKLDLNIVNYLSLIRGLAKWERFMEWRGVGSPGTPARYYITRTGWLPGRGTISRGRFSAGRSASGPRARCHLTPL